MSDRVPSIFFLVPGPWQAVEAVRDALREAGVASERTGDSPFAKGALRVDVVSDPGGFGDALTWGRDGRLPPDVIAAAAKCTHAALLEFGFLLQDDPALVAKAGRALQQAGGVAVRAEASSCASTWESWLQRLESGDADRLVYSAVSIIGGEGEFFTCGMHAFDLPDAEIFLNDERAAIELLDVLCTFQLAEKPVLATGHTFRPDADSDRRRLERWPDHRHRSNDGRRNPFGLWRLVPDDASALHGMDPIPTIIPTLASQLMAAEGKRGRPLTREEVESLTEAATAVALAPKDAASLERSRGYADLEPRRAWEQWQLVRSGT